MAADDLTAPLGQQRKKPRRAIRVPVLPIIAGALGLFLVVFVLWAAVGNDPFGGEPMAVAPIQAQPPAAKRSATAAAHGMAAGQTGPGRYFGPASVQGAANQQKSAPSPGTTTINIINGTTGTHQQVTIPAPADQSKSPPVPPVDQKFIEMTPQGAIPKIAADGTRPADAFAQPVKALPGKPDAPRIALIVGGLGVSAKDTADALANLPGPVTLAFIPYAKDAAWVASAREQGHEVLLEAPMEPFDYPENDSGPQTLLTSLTPQQNIARLHWLMSRFQGYVGLINMMGARFTSSEQAFGPILREIAGHGLIFVDDGSNPRSVAGRIAGANNLPFAQAVTLDSVAAPDEIDRALDRLEATARQRHVAVGFASALPVSIARIANWAKSAASRGVLLVPITAVAMKDKPS
jgi:uncharacterized protein